MTVYQQLRQARQAVAKLQAIVNGCKHKFGPTTTTLTSQSIRARDFWSGEIVDTGQSQFVKILRRECEECGLMEKAVVADPNRPPVWEEER